MEPVRKTKIVCTIGPATDDPEMMGKLMDAGMDVARLNFSHGGHDVQKRTFDNLRDAAGRRGREISILCDIPGPKIRTGVMRERFLLNSGDTVRVTAEEVSGTPDRFTVRYPGLLDELRVGEEIFVNDGIVKLRVTGKKEGDLVCTVRSGGLISDSKGCNIPGAALKVRVPTEKDRKDLDLIAQLDPEFVAVSFAANPSDMKEVRGHLSQAGNDKIKLIAKVERPVALKNLDGLIEASDGIMVARGDLGVEIPPQEVPIWQKEICRKCNRAGIPVIVATQMLDSMTEHSRPTRAEASDVFNSVLDGTDAVMLSNETAVGKYPAGSVEFMKDILLSAERHLPSRDPDYYDSDLKCRIETVGHACSTMVKEFNDRGYAGKVLAITDTGQSARMVSKYRPDMDIIAITPERRTAREMILIWGVTPVHSRRIDNTSLETRIMSSIKDVVDRGLLSPGDQVIVVSSSLVIGDEGMVLGIYDSDSVVGH